MNFVTPFEHALEQNPAPRRLGDVTLRFEPSMLIGETRSALRSAWPTVCSGAGIVCVVLAIAALAFLPEVEIAMTLAVFAAVAFSAGVLLERLDRRRRAFVANFATTSLRLDFVTPIVGHPKTVIVHFDGVRALGFYEQGDGRQVLTVDFVPTSTSSEVLREVLIASISEAEHDDARRLYRVLCGAFGLGDVPADSTWVEPPPQP